MKAYKGLKSRVPISFFERNNYSNLNKLNVNELLNYHKLPTR